MSARKLSDADRKAILEEYRQPGETTLTIANRYGVSNSTISRMLKSSLSPKEYEMLISQKRATRTHHSPARTPAKKKQIELSSASEQPEKSEQPEQPELSEKSEKPEKPEKPKKIEKIEKAAPSPSPSSVSDSTGRRRRKRSSAHEDEDIENIPDEPPSPLPVKAVDDERNEEVRPDKSKSPPKLKRDRAQEESDLEEEDFELSEGLEDFEDDEDFEDVPGDESDEEPPTKKAKTIGLGAVQVLPFAGASLPKTCYLVVDRAAELITRPLKDFGDLGQIPAREVSEKTLPIFDNHRVARRFANRSQRVTKIPDSRMLQKVSAYLLAKGITRILIDGQVYSL
ncbi:hypothetical protein IQ235_17165 [Oscillatoriales cyanobacterium LEGE 11467]|uniref:Transposase n=2 Tax=Zarconia TaxID=2992130 RepID=A0A928ZA64_9CYAN|nr:hypothetical protein [Zarconia navalis LEGE 11467]